MDQIQNWGNSFYRKLRWRVALTTAAIYLLPFAVFYALVDHISVRQVRSQIYGSLQAHVAANVELLDDVFDVRVTEVRSLAQAMSGTGSPLAQSPAMLDGYVTSHPWYWLLAVIDTSGQIRAASGEIRGNIKDREYFRQALAGETVISDVFASPLTKKPEMVLASPLHGGGNQIVGVLVAALRLDKLHSRLLDPGIGQTAEAILASATGQFIASSHSDRAALIGQAFDAGQPNPYQGEAGLTEHRDYRGDVVLCAYRKLKSKDYYIVAHVSREEILAPVRALRRAILFYVVPFLVLGIALAAGAGNYGVNYLQRLTLNLRQALQLAGEHERERDVAHQELAQRFEKEMELAKEKAQFQAQMAEYEKYAALARLALGAAHEINNPLLGILTHLELEVEEAKSNEDRVEVEQCIEAAKRISSTLRALLNYARPGPLQLDEINLGSLVSDALAFLRHQPLFRGKALEKDIPAHLPCISADANQISQVLMNLLLNAADATPEGGKITVSAKMAESEQEVEICVADTGRGIPAEVLPNIFDPFFTTKGTKGTGLGLSITQAYVRSHRGEIQIESTPQQGTIVRITLPVRQEESSMSRTSEEVI